MSTSTSVVERYFGALQRRDHAAIAACYHPDATFRDIAFELSGRPAIHAMWHMITETDFRLVSHSIASVDIATATGRWTAEYTFRDTGRPVRNEVTSAFGLEDGLIRTQRDTCDSLRWGVQALGPVNGVLSWLVPSLRRRKAEQKVKAFIDAHPEYR